MDKKQTLINLIEKYEYEFSQHHGWDVDEFGLYDCDVSDEYWSENESYAAYFIEANGQLAGFVMIAAGAEGHVETDYLVDEFFIMHKYRRHGIGKKAVFEIFDIYKGSWKIVFTQNATSAYFG
ncbi:MAG: GNAT family N-acetyltransferase [Defluviitaleaceae bacterium]|nr:GNAT family N-acetyltransferase [Defluviitaleaceae bacterium]